MFPTDVVIVAGARTPMARYTGAFSDVSAIDLAAHASKEAIRRSGVDPGEFDHVIIGNVMQTSADALYGARHVGLKTGLKIETPAVTVNRLCGSGIEAIAQAAQEVLPYRLIECMDVSKLCQTLYPHHALSGRRTSNGAVTRHQTSSFLPVVVGH